MHSTQCLLKQQVRLPVSRLQNRSLESPPTPSHMSGSAELEKCLEIQIGRVLVPGRQRRPPEVPRHIFSLLLLKDPRE